MVTQSEKIILTMQSTIDNLSISLLLGILGISITIFTVIYSFMESTKQRKRDIGDRLSLLQEPDPLLEADLAFTIDYLKRLKHTNVSILVIIFADILITGFYAVHMILSQISILWYIAMVLELVLIIGCLICLYLYLRQYHQRFSRI